VRENGPPLRLRREVLKASLEYFAGTLEFFANFPIIDKTGLTHHFGFDLNGTQDDLKKQNLDAVNEAFALLGLELVSSRESIEMPVVEKAK
jgi:uncharacterized protein (TIGR03435 family)